jgi:inhibitor of KinA sporulation pathway (predicted exonuclease)
MAKLQKQGVTYAEACRRLTAKHGALGRLLVVDSIGDVISVRNQCALMGVPFPFGEEYFNVSTHFNLVTRQKRKLSLEEKLAVLGLQFEGVQHRAAPDSANIARLLIELIKSGRASLAVGATQSS